MKFQKFCLEYKILGDVLYELENLIDLFIYLIYCKLSIFITSNYNLLFLKTHILNKVYNYLFYIKKGLKILLYPLFCK